MVTHGEKGDCDFCVTNGLVIAETLFSHKRSRKHMCGDPLVGSMRTKLSTWLKAKHGGARYRTLG